MATPKSPFFVIQNFISPKQCEIIVDDLNIFEADLDQNGNAIKMMRTHEAGEAVIYEKLQEFVPLLEKYYDFQYRATEQVVFEYYTEGVKTEAKCDNAKWINKKWVKTRDRDFSAVLFFSDYQNKIPFDSEYEVYGGKYEFLQHKFGFTPERGTLVIYPSGPHFINAVAEIAYGDLFLAKFHIASLSPFLYQPSEFPGDFKSWFSHLK